MRTWAFAVVTLAAGPLQAQRGPQSPPLAVWGEVFVGSELERYLRLLQVTSDAPLYPWSVRGFSPREVDRLWPKAASHPWAGRYDAGKSSGRFQLNLIRPSLTTSFNTTFPYGSNDGPVWAGKGLTTSIQGGYAARYGPVSLTVAPIAFRAENADFELMSNGKAGQLAYADGRFPTQIDKPQRFGSEPYARLDPGQSTLRVDLPVVALGVSTANQHWGPALEYPILLGNNAPGYPHAFLGSSAPLDVWLVKAHGRVVWGELSQTEFSSVPDTASRRFMSGVVGVITPRGVPGLELGAARFFHQPWPAGGLRLRNFTKPFESILKVGLPDTTDIPGGSREERGSVDNQLATVFGRWVLPSGGFELYGEYGREDHNWDLRDLVLEPDHSAGYMLGFRKAWGRAPVGLVALSGEVFDVQASHLVRSMRGTPSFYSHLFTRQGHSHLGQLLGAAPGVEGAGFSIALERFHPNGRWTLSWRREVRQAAGQYWQTGVRDPKSLDVIHTVGAEALFFRGPVDITASVAGTYNFNRNFGSDAFNLNAFLRVQSAIPWTIRSGAPTAPSTPLDQPQEPPRTWSASDGPPETYVLGSDAEDRIRLDQLLGASDNEGFLIRSLSHQWDQEATRHQLSLYPIGPMVQTVWNSDLPLSLNDGALWAGSGANARLLAGVRATWGPLSLTIAPQLVFAENRDFEQPDARLAPVLPPSRSPFASPWHIRPGSIDQPLRFGSENLTYVDPGQSTLSAKLGGWVAGVSTEEQWWGPGIRNAIVMSNNAPGFPHVFVRTARPLKTRAGSFEGKWLVGGLRESDYFDTDGSNNLRSLSAIAVTWTPTFEPGLTLGLARAVYAPASGWDDVLARWPNVVFTDPGRPNDRPPSDSSQVPGPDQIYSLFGRWVFPSEGFEVYGEWSRTELPASFRDFLVAPNHTQGFTIGVQWAKPVKRGRGNGERGTVIRLQSEMTYLEESTTFRDRPMGSYYTSRAVTQGYTHKGQVIGAAIGPGASSQWLALDYFAPRWSLGLFGGRIRWENDALYTVPDGAPGNKFCMHDVSVFGGLRAGYNAPMGNIVASLSRGTRMNVHFQNFTYCSDPDSSQRTYVPNTRIELAFTPRW